jgi:hypothetical protein
LPVHHNEDYDWDRFDAQEYFEQNYRTMRRDDAVMLDLVRDWFAEAASFEPGMLEGVDVGSGTNLYPAFAMLPYCSSISLREYSRENVRWLESTVLDLPDSWRPFWEGPGPHTSAYRDFESVKADIGKRCVVEQGSVFDLPSARWGIGTMFFVAESLTEDLGEFDRALGRFIGALKPGAPFAAAFMEGSEGYDNGGAHFPAVTIGTDQLAESFDALGAVGELALRRVEIDPKPLRPGYTGYLVAIGKVKG